MAIGRSGGALRGRGIAISGIVLGLIASVFWVIAAVSAVQVSRIYSTQFSEPIAGIISDAEAGNAEGVLAALTPESAASVTPENVRRWVETYQAETGAFSAVPESLWDMIKLSLDIGPSMQRFKMGEAVAPLPARFAEGPAVIIVRFEKANPTAGPGGFPLLQDIGVMTVRGEEFWLVDGSTAGEVPAGAPSDEGSGG